MGIPYKQFTLNKKWGDIGWGVETLVALSNRSLWQPLRRERPTRRKSLCILDLASNIKKYIGPDNNNKKTRIRKSTFVYFSYNYQCLFILCLKF